MAGSETTYTIATRGPIVLAQGRACTSTLPAELDGSAVTPSAASCVLLGLDGTQVAAPTVSIVGSTAQAAYGATALDEVDLAAGYVESWTLTLGGVVRSVRRLVAVSTFELHPPVEQADLVAGEYPDLVNGLGDYATSLGGYLLGAWREIVRYLVQKARVEPDTIVSSDDVYEWHRHTTLARLFRSQFRDVGDRMHTLWLFHEGEATKARTSAAFVLDRDRDGLPDAGGARQPLARHIHPNVPPTTSTPRGFRW